MRPLLSKNLDEISASMIAAQVVPAFVYPGTAVGLQSKEEISDYCNVCVCACLYAGMCVKVRMEKSGNIKPFSSTVKYVLEVFTPQ